MFVMIRNEGNWGGSLKEYAIPSEILFEYFRENYVILTHLKKHATGNLCLGLAKSTISHSLNHELLY